ncbi:MAG TPA: hypothetical protein VKK79_24460 [Candidatus Lokiarchaeia archaeon]|nr:hypothetical protein [Candidatus Lokiarchaeia archaeon]
MVQYEVLCIGATVEEKTISVTSSGETQILFDYREQKIITPNLGDRKYENAGS